MSSGGNKRNFNKLSQSVGWTTDDESSGIHDGEEAYSCPNCGVHIGYLGADDEVEESKAFAVYNEVAKQIVLLSDAEEESD